MMRFRLLFFVAIGILISLPAGSMLKQQYGGTLKVAEELLQGIETQQMAPAETTETTLTLDISSLPDSRQQEIGRAIDELQEYTGPCHWILDYPNLNHNHQTSIRIDQGKIRIETTSAETLSALSSSSCLIPLKIPEFQAFRKTQFGYEANAACISGRPFLDSIMPVPVDPLNPYLSLKLGDVDAVNVPEDRFQEMKNDPELRLTPGSKTFLYLKSSNLTQQEVAWISQNIDAEELARTLLNNHAEILFTRPSGIVSMKLLAPISISAPLENPYHLLAERMIVQLQGAGIQAQPSSTSQSKSIELGVLPLSENNSDLTRYLLLRNVFRITKDRTWFEEWDELEATGKIVPLMIHQTSIAARKQIQNLQTHPNGSPDFSNCWILTNESEVPR